MLCSMVLWGKLRARKKQNKIEQNKTNNKRPKKVQRNDYGFPTFKQKKLLIKFSLNNRT